jgi:hypothetical protein
VSSEILKQVSEIGIVHLVWQPAGTEPLKRFIDAYHAFPAGMDHDLIVVFNGFSGADMAEHRELLAKTPHRELAIDGGVLDIAAYFWAARQLDCRYVCFLNSYSTPLVSGWLSALHVHAVDPAIGAAGATGSWESFYSSYQRHRNADARSRLARLLRSPYHRWKMARYRANFPPAPNPHLRSNAFMLERSRFLLLQPPRIKTKWDTWVFESGRQGMTAKLLAQGLRVVIVGRDGHAYAPEEWQESATFRLDEQRNLLIGDNRTGDFDKASAEERALLSALAWGAG